LASGITLGYIAAQIGLKSQVGVGVAVRSFIRPLEAADWLPFVALGAWAISLLLVRGWRPARFVAAAFAFAVPVRLLAEHARIAREWSRVEKLGYLSLLAAMIGFVWLLLAADDEEQPASGRLVCIIIVAAGIAVVLTLSGVLVYGQLSAALSAALTGAALACISLEFLPLPLGEGRGEGESRSSALREPAIRRLPGAAGIIACLLSGLIILGYFYAELSTTNAALLIAALAAAAAPLPKSLARHSAWLHIAARALLCITLLAMAIVSLFNESSNPY
jgi:hypothetical protein